MFCSREQSCGSIKNYLAFSLLQLIQTRTINPVYETTGVSTESHAIKERLIETILKSCLLLTVTSLHR